MSQEQTAPVIPKETKKGSKKGSKRNETKLVIGATDYMLDHERKESEPRQKQHAPKSKSHQKPRNHKYNHQQQQLNPQMQQQKFLEMSYSYNLSCLLEENCLSAGSFVRKFMDDDGFIKCEIFAKIFRFVFYFDFNNFLGVLY